MVLLATTPLIQSLLSSLPPDNTLQTTGSDAISHDKLIHLSRLTQTNLHTLLRGTKPYFPPPKPPPTPSPEYLALKARLVAQEEARAYAALLATRKALSEENEDGKDEDNIPLSLPFNILVSIICCGGAVFWMTQYWHNVGLRVLVSMGTALLVGIAEVVVYAGYLRKVREAKAKERQKKEIKVVDVDVGVMNEADDAKEAENIKRTGMLEEEEIWGKGVNGGRRRRVREKWEREKEKQREDEDEGGEKQKKML